MCCLLQVSCGFERTIASNFFGHFWLTQLLLDDLKAAAPSRWGQGRGGQLQSHSCMRASAQQLALKRQVAGATDMKGFVCH
jgi:NAD(P)-dependent dehydrogenase (short-subunit alcohol dehydrogenase family)